VPVIPFDLYHFGVMVPRLGVIEERIFRREQYAIPFLSLVDNLNHYLF
jgi:hypothetical protein